MLRAFLIALFGLLYFIISLPMMMPLRMMKEPIVNYNLFFVPFLIVLFSFLFYRSLTIEKESKAYIYSFFAAIVAWQLFGEMASMPVEKGLITQFSDVNIKSLGGYFYLLGGWITLKVLWRTKAVKNSVAVLLLTFLSIWTFELYMDNYSAVVPLDLMPTISYIIGSLALGLSVLLLIVAKKAAKVETKTVMGCLLYVTFSLAIMGFGPWTKPSTFYIKHEGQHIGREIAELKEKQANIEKIREHMIADGLLKADNADNEKNKSITKDPRKKVQ